MQDPFFAVKEEVEHSVTVVTQLHAKWEELNESKRGGDEFEWTTSELLSGLRSIEWDLQDLEDTVSIVKGNRQKFQLEDADVQAREDFIEQTREQITAMRDEVQGAQTNVAGGFSTKKASSGMPSLGKGKGYVSAVGQDEEAGGGVPMASMASDEILGMESTGDSPGGRHAGKKLCLGVTFVLLLLAGGAAASMMGKKEEGRRRLGVPQPASPQLSSAAPTWSSVFVTSFSQ